jgi:hypothetical protein
MPVVDGPQAVSADAGAIKKAQESVPTYIDPVSPPPPVAAQPISVVSAVQNVINTVTVNNHHETNISVTHVNNTVVVHPQVWNYVDYDVYRRPIFYNPLLEALTFRYFYQGLYREVFVPAGGRIVLNMAVPGVFPYTACGQRYVAVGSLVGGGWIPPAGWAGPPPREWVAPPPPTVYRAVKVYLPKAKRVVTVKKITMVGRDDSRPPTERDSFMIDDSTLAWGKVDTKTGQVEVAKTQTLPGVGPIDNGESLIVPMATADEGDWYYWAGGSVLLALLAGVAGWAIVRRGKGSHAILTDPPTDRLGW